MLPAKEPAGSLALFARLLVVVADGFSRRCDLFR
jgi:hypothetical protein